MFSIICYCEASNDDVLLLTFGNKQYKLYHLSNKIAQEALESYWSAEKSNPFYLHLSAMPIIGTSENTKDWRIYRSETRERFFDDDAQGRSCLVLWQRTTKKQHLIYHTITMNDIELDERVERERIGAGLSTMYRNRNIDNKKPDATITNNLDFSKYKPSYSGREYVAIPVGKLNSDNKTHFICNVDYSVDFDLYNVNVNIAANFTEFKGTDIKQTLSESTTLFEVAIAISEYIRKPFPAKERIENLVSRYYFDRFDLSKKSIKVGEEVKLDIAYTIEATRHPEWIRLRATSGEFRRDKNDVYYKATQAGKQILFLEAISGTGANGSPVYDVSFAEQLQIEINVTEKNN